MTVKQFFPDVMVRTARIQYHLVCDAKDMDLRVSRKQAAQAQFDPEFPVGWRVEWEIVETLVPGCPWCGVRPELFEPDCDGPAATGTCGSEQCNQLKRCEGCGTNGSVRYGSVRGQLCEGCHETARRDGLEAAQDRYALIPSTW